MSCAHKPYFIMLGHKYLMKTLPIQTHPLQYNQAHASCVQHWWLPDYCYAIPQLSITHLFSQCYSTACC